MRWPWQQAVETRAVDYTDSLVALLTQRAEGSGGIGDVTATGALEAVSGVVGRAFAYADITATSPTVAAALNPDLLELFGRAMIRSGELVCYLDSSGGQLNILPAQSHSITGGPMPSSWRYDLSLPGPNMTQSYTDVSAERVLHLKYSHHQSTPWRGASALEIATLAGRLSASTIKTLADESRRAVG